jgi:hypothetical protein
MISRLKRAEPVTLVRSPTLTNSESAPMLQGSRPDSRQATGSSGMARGGCGLTASTMARIWSGVVPQQPPMMLMKPLAAQSPSSAAICAGVSSYSPNSFGRPAFGCAET